MRTASPHDWRCPRRIPRCPRGKVWAVSRLLETTESSTVCGAPPGSRALLFCRSADQSRPPPQIPRLLQPRRLLKVDSKARIGDFRD